MKSKKNKKQQESSEIKKAEPLPELGTINIPLSEQELLTLINLMSVSIKTFDILSIQYLAQNDETNYNVFSARKKLMESYVAKFSSMFTIGEPDSREYH